MSNVPATPIHDLTAQELELLKAFNEAGKPGVGRISDQQIFRWHNLYLAGKSYEEIATLTKSQVELVLYTSHKHSWLEKKEKYHAAIAQKLQGKLMATRMEGLVFLTDIMHLYHDRLGKKVAQYIETKDESLTKDIDAGLRNLDKYFKAMDTIDKLVFKSGKDPEDSAPKTQHYYNFFGGAEISKTGENTVQIKTRTVEQAENDTDLIEMEKFVEANTPKKS